MSPGIETELRDALAHASESIMPRADLADRVRRAGRRRRHVLTRVIAAGLATVVAGSLIAIYGIGHGQHRPAANHHDRRRGGVTIVIGYDGPDHVAANGRWIYVTAGDGNPGSVMFAYDRATGRLVRSIAIPALASSLQVGPGGLVWLSFYPDSNGGGTGVWLLSPDLKARSGVNLGTKRYHGAAPFDVLLTGTNTAVLATDYGLATLRLPSPGQPGAPALHWLPRVPGSRRIQGLPVQVAAFAGRLAVRVDSDGGRQLISFAGSRSAEFIPKPADALSPVAASASGLWTTLSTDNGQTSLGLIRLDNRLRLSTPRTIRSDPVLRGAQQVVTLGSTVWVTLSGPAPSLACFIDRGGHIGPVTKSDYRPEPATNNGAGGLAAVGHTLYVLGPIAVASYPIPGACR
jgi:hypothetical protein